MNTVDVKVHSPTATIIMDRRAAGNALDDQLIADLSQALSDLHQEQRVRAVVLSGAGADFCRGMDLDMLKPLTNKDEREALPLWIEQWQRVSELLEQFLRFPKPILAAVDGRAWGSGLALVLACDLVVASQTASFAVPAVQRGMMGGIVAPLVNFRCGSAVASRMTLTGEAITSREAQRFGLVSQRTSSDLVWVVANELAGRVARSPASALAATKRLLNETIGESLLTQISVGAAAAATVCSTPAAAEGVKAWGESS